MTTTAHTPCRIDLAGGTLDIWPIPHSLPEPAVTVNVALDLPARTRVMRLGSVDEPSTEIHLESTDLRLVESFADREALKVATAKNSTKLPLLGRAVLAVMGAQGIAVQTEAGSPAGAGLGGSSALLCSLLGALYGAFRGEPGGSHLVRRPSEREIQALAQNIETSLLGAPTGYQDYFPPLFGGCLALEGALTGVEVEPLAVNLRALGRRMRLVYTGVPHVSGVTNWGVVRAFFDGERKTVETLHRLARIARDVRDALRVGALDFALHGVIADGRERLAMAPGISTDEINDLDRVVCAAGAMGTKVMGAGGGGCVLVLLPDRSEAIDAVDRALDQGPWQRIDVTLSKTGLTVVDENDPVAFRRDNGTRLIGGESAAPAIGSAEDSGTQAPPSTAESTLPSDTPTNGTPAAKTRRLFPGEPSA